MEWRLCQMFICICSLHSKIRTLPWIFLLKYIFVVDTVENFKWSPSIKMCPVCHFLWLGTTKINTWLVVPLWKLFRIQPTRAFLLVFFSHWVLGEVERFFDRGQAHAPIPDDGLRLLSVHNLQGGRTLHGATWTGMRRHAATSKSLIECLLWYTWHPMT